MATTSGFTDVDDFLAGFAQIPARKRSRAAERAPLPRLQLAAREHPDPFVRRACLDFLDHHANEASAVVFAAALSDPVEPVRNMALHAIACERCRSAELCFTEVVPALIRVIETDPSPEMRHTAIPKLLEFVDRDPRAHATVEDVAVHDRDDLVRDVARRALAGEHIRDRKSYERISRCSAATLSRERRSGGGCRHEAHRHRRCAGVRQDDNELTCDSFA